MSYCKFHNKKVTVDGIVFDSKKESKRYLELKPLAEKGIITGLELQKKFCICPKTETVKRARFYLADFYYIDENGVKVIEDVKSPITAKEPLFTLKRDLVKWLFPDIDFRIIL